MNFEGSIELPEAEVERCAAEHDVRYYLNQPYLDFRGPEPMLVATNGHLIVAAPVKVTGDVKQGHIPIEAIERARKNRQDPLTLHFTGDMCGTKDALFLRPWMDEPQVKYPEWRRVIPELDKGATPDIAFSGGYLDVLARTLCPGSMQPGINVYLSKAKDGISGSERAVRVRGHVDDAVLAALMPMSR